MNPSLEKYLSRHVPETVRWLQDFIRIPTVVQPGRCYRECAEFISERLSILSIPHTVHEVEASEVAAEFPDYEHYGRYNVIARWDVGAAKTIHFNGHYDVVPVSDTWQYDPFGGQLIDDRIYGRGTADMKGSLAALLLAVEAFKASGEIPACNIEMSFVCDEEVGGFLGSGWVARKGLVKADCAVVCEGASDNRVGIGHNGVLWIRSHVGGKSTHASTPEMGVNAFEKMAAMVLKLQDYRDFLSDRTFQSPCGSILRPTINPGGLFGGGSAAKTNTVPGEAWFTIDRRILPDEGVKRAEPETLAFLHQAAETLGIDNFKTEIRLRLRPYFIMPDHPFVSGFARVLESVSQAPASYYVTRGFTDAHYFARELDLPTLGYGVAGKNIHADNEFIRIGSLEKTARVYSSLMAGGV